ncbi:MAG TPA: hypothetical protein VGD31_11095 [Sphingobacteriaceae bacterium]
MEFQLTRFFRFSELPFDTFESLDWSIYVLDFNWNYLFVNQFVYKNLKATESLIGKNMWETFPLLVIDPDFRLMKKNMEMNKATNIITISPLTGQRLSIIGYALEDCYFFSASIMLNKEDLISDLRKYLDKAS